MIREGWYRQGFGGRIGYGISPAVIVVDVTLGFTRPDSPLGASVESVVHAIQRLLAAARAQHLPIAFTTVAYSAADRLTAATFLRKVPALGILDPASPWVQIDPMVAPRPEEPVFTKLYASAFFGTPLLSLLVTRQIDTVIVTGLTTSGCVRATVVDALQHGFRPIVPREAVGDRNPVAHETSLSDIDAKYGDVVNLDEVLAYLTALQLER